MIINWIVIGVFIIIGLIVLQLEHHSRRIKALVFAVIGLVLYFSLVGILSSGEVSIDSPRGIINAVYTYFGWIGETGSKLWDIGTDTASLVGNAVKVNATS